MRSMIKDSNGLQPMLEQLTKKVDKLEKAMRKEGYGKSSSSSSSEDEKEKAAMKKENCFGHC